MGGSGSGTWYRWNKRITTEEVKQIDIRYLKKHDLLQPGYRRSLSWTYADKQTTIALEPIYWQAIDALSESPGAWITDCIGDKPASVSRSSWIRQRVLISMLRNIEV